MAPMKWLGLILKVIFGAYLLVGFGMLFLRLAAYIRGRLTYKRWLCPQCKRPFGGSHRIWRPKGSVIVKDGPRSGPVFYCGLCDRDFWFTWYGQNVTDWLPGDGSEIVERVNVSNSREETP